MSMKDYLRDWSIWLFPQHGNTDTASDPTGARVMTQNQNNDPWYIPGTWGRVMNPRRRITVPRGTRLFIVAASSHATPDELPDNQNATPANLTQHAQDVDRSWFSATLAAGPLDGPLTNLNLATEVTDVLQVDIDPGSQYAALTGVSGRGIDMVSVGRVHLYTPDRGVTRITIAGQAPELPNLGRRGEREYNVQVTYEVTVQ